MGFLRVLLVVLSIFSLSSCTIDEDDANYVFIGDSIISRWKLNTYFREVHTYNAGKGGSGVAYIESKAGSYKSQTIIVHFGTNDIQHIESEEEYVERYISAVEKLGGSRVVILPIMPRGKVESAHASFTMPKIRRLNAMLKNSAEQKGWFFVDVFDKLLDGEFFSDECTVDGIHPSDKGYAILTVEVRKYM